MNYIYVKDINNEKKAMSLDKFAGMLFTHCFKVLQYGTKANIKIDHTHTKTINVDYALEDSHIYMITVTRRIRKINENYYSIQFLDEANNSRVVYRVDFNYMIPVVIENHMGIKFMRKCFTKANV